MKKLTILSVVMALGMLGSFADGSVITAQSVNLALGKTVTQSTDIGQPFNARDGLAFKAVDGNTDGTWNNGSVTSTACGIDATNECRGSTDPWWQVDLGADFQINKIQIWNRTDCCQERLNNWRLWVKTSTGNWEAFTGNTGFRSFDPSEGNPITVQGSKQARFVMVQVTNPNAFVSLAEVMVFGSPLTPVATQTQGMTRQQLEDEFRTCVEAQQHGPSTDAEFTTSLYWRYLGHGPDGNLQFHTARITSRQLTRQQLDDEFRTCSEAQQHGPSTDLEFTRSLFWRYLGRDGSDGAHQFHVVRLKAVQSVATPVIPTTNPNSGNGSADAQFWDAVKNSQRAQDFQSYLSAFPNGQFAGLARFKMNQLAPAPPIQATTQPSSGNSSADEQFWDSVKNSQRAQDFQSYLSAFPNGQFAGLARFKMGQLAPAPTTVTPVTTGNLSVDEQFWNSVKNSGNSRDFQSYLDNFPNGQFAALARFNRDRLGGVPAPVNPPANVPTTSRNAQFLNRLAAENRAKLPLTVGDIQLFDSVSVCQSGCQQTGSSESVVIRARTPNLAKQSISIGQVEQSLKSAMLKGYCGSPEQINNVTMNIDVDDMFNQKIGNFFINARDCTGNTGTAPPPPTTTAKPPVTGFQQVIAAAQPGSISEIARARKFFVVSNDFSIKSKITSAILKELPQMQAASTEQEADFFIGFELTDRTTGLVTTNDKGNPNLRGELIVFTTIPATNNRPESIRILFRVTKERGFGVFSATPDENAAKEFAKQFAKVII